MRRDGMQKTLRITRIPQEDAKTLRITRIPQEDALTRC